LFLLLFSPGFGPGPDIIERREAEASFGVSRHEDIVAVILDVVLIIPERVACRL